MLYDPEFASLVAFVAFLRDEERDSFSVEDLGCLNFRTHRPLVELRSALQGMGFALVKRGIPRKVRGFTSSSNDRWFGPGSEPTHGGH